MTTYADATAVPESTFTYRVRATSDAGPSRYTNEATVTTPPRDPGGLMSGTVSDTQLLIRWGDLSDAESGYEVERGEGCPGSNFALLATLEADATSFQDDTAEPETTYAYRVRAINENGASDWTPEICATTPPYAPTGLEGDALSPSRIRI